MIGDIFVPETKHDHWAVLIPEKGRTTLRDAHILEKRIKSQPPFAIYARFPSKEKALERVHELTRTGLSKSYYAFIISRKQFYSQKCLSLPETFRVMTKKQIEEYIWIPERIKGITVATAERLTQIGKSIISELEQSWNRKA